MDKKNNHRALRYALATALVASLALAGCKKKDEAVPPPVAAAPDVAPAPSTPATPPATTMPMSTVTVTGVDLGTAVGSDMKVTAPATSFAKSDTIIAAVSTHSSDPTVAGMGKLSAKWTFQDGQVVNEESQDFNFTGDGVTDFRISKPDGFPAGDYKVEISLDGASVQSKDFSIK
jgi:hypothetical protein